MEQIDASGHNDKSSMSSIERVLAKLNEEEPITVYQCLNPLTNNLHITVIMSVLEENFNKTPNNVYMFYEPYLEHPNYQWKKCWSEITGLDVNEVKLLFDEVGVRYSSYKEYLAAQNKFESKYYCSFYDKNSKKVHYFRNDDVVEKAIESVLPIDTGKS